MAAQAKALLMPCVAEMAGWAADEGPCAGLSLEHEGRGLRSGGAGETEGQVGLEMGSAGFSLEPVTCA